MEFQNSNGIISLVAENVTRMYVLTDAIHFNNDIIAFSATASDSRLKNNIVTIKNSLDKVKALRGVEYDWNAGSRKGEHEIGLIAQEVEEVIPYIVKERKLPLINDDGELYKTVDYEKIVALLIEAVKEQQIQIDELKANKA
jgi:hypothetical protein